ncbi:MAG: hypothetical protein AAGA10_25680 [Bacteroidota bacterium]
MNPIFYAVVSILLVATSQFLFKQGVSELSDELQEVPSIWQKAIKAMFKPTIFGGLALNGIAAFFWLLALSDLELSFIFPFLALNYILIPVGASILYKEELTSNRVIGIFVICAGVLVIAFS